MATFLSRTASYAALSRFKSSPDFSTQHRQGRWHAGILPHAFSFHANRLMRKGVSDQKKVGREVGSRWDGEEEEERVEHSECNFK